MAGADFEAQALELLMDLKGEVGTARADIAEVKGDILAVKAGNAERCKVRGDVLDDHEDRIRDLEKQATYGKGKLAGICTASSVGGVGLWKVGTWIFAWLGGAR